MKYVFEFDETGGYDCMYGAFIVKVEGSEATLFEIDCRHYGQRSCDYKDAESIAVARSVAQKVVDALNAAKHESSKEKP